MAPTLDVLVLLVLYKSPTISATFFVFLPDRLQCDEIFVQFVTLNEFLAKASMLLQKVPSFTCTFLT